MSKKIHIVLLQLSFFFLIPGTIINAQTGGGGIPTGTDTTCTNGISVFQKLYGGSKDDLAEWLAASADSGYVIAGQTNSFGNGAFDGLLTKVSKKGNTVWSKAVGGSGNDVLYGIKRTSDNGFIAVGQTKSYGNPAGDAWLVKLDASGTIQWSKKYGDGNANGDVAYEVVQLSDGGYAFNGIHQDAGGVSGSWVVRTDNQGNVLWSKQYGFTDSDGAWGITEDGNSLIVVGFYRNPSFYDGYVMKLDKSTGVVQWIRTYDIEVNRHMMMAKVRVTNTGYQVFSLVMDDFAGTNQQQVIWNLNTDGTVQNVRKMVVPGIQTSGYGWSPLADGSFVVANGENNNGADVIFTQVNAAGNMLWSKKYFRGGKQWIRAMVPSPEGGYAATGNNNNAGTTADSTDIYLTRIDSLGNSGLCSGINTNDVTVVVPSFSSSAISVAPVNVTINNPVITAGVQSFIPVTNTLCFSCQFPIPIIPPDTVCANGIPFYQKLYGGSKDDLAEWLAASADSGYVIAGQTNSFGNGAFDGLLTKVSKKGNTVWSKAVGGSGNDVLYGIKRTSDNGFIAVGQTKSYGNPAGDAWLVKLDASGTIQWSKKYGDGNANGDVAYEVVQLSDGGYAFNGIHQDAGGVSGSWVVRTDNQGNVLWSKQYGFTDSDGAWGITEDGNSLIVVGFYRNPSFYDGYVMKLDKSTGVVQWIRTYDIEVNRHMMMAKVRVTNTGYQVFSLVMDDFAGTNQQQVIWNLNTDGTVQNVRKMVVPGIQTSGYGWSPLADGSFVVANGENNNGADVIFTQVNAAGNMLWSKKYFRGGKQWIRAMVPSPEGGYAATGNNNNAGTTADSTDIYLTRIDSLGNSGLCSGINTNDVTVVVPSFSSSAISVAPVNVTINNPVITAGVQNFVPVTNTICFYCQPKPTGTARPATTGRNPHTLRVYPNPVIGGTVNLSIDAGYDDRAVISIVDLTGNILYKSSSIEVKKGQNNIRLDMPYNLQSFTNYFIQVRYSEAINSIKIFVVNR